MVELVGVLIVSTVFVLRRLLGIEQGLVGTALIDAWPRPVTSSLLGRWSRSFETATVG